MTIGPDSEAPNWWRSSGAFFAVGSAKKFLASKASLRRYSKTVPCHSLLPDLVETETTPAPRPNSAEKVPVSTLNSRTDSTVGCTITVLNVNSLLSMPSTSQALVLACEPSALKFEAPRGLKVDAPDRFSPDLAGRDAGDEVDERREVAAVERQLAHRALLDHLAQLGGVGARERREARSPRSVSVRPPTSSVASTRARWFTCSTTPRWTYLRKPASSTATSYVPGIRNGATKEPSASVVWVLTRALVSPR